MVVPCTAYVGWPCPSQAIIMPFRSEQLLSSKWCYIIIALTWIIGFFLATVNFKVDATWNTTACGYRYPRDTGFEVFFLAYFVVAALLPRVLLVYGTVRIFIVVLRAHRQVASLEQFISVGGIGTTNTGANITAHAIRSGINVLIICVVSTVLTTPVFVFSIIRNTTDMEFPRMFVFAALWLFQLSSVINSLVYLVLFRTVRKMTCKIFYTIFTYIRGE